MKLENLTLGIQILKTLQNNPNCTIPQIKDNFNIKSLSPPCKEEKNLYKVISFLNNRGFLEKNDNPTISQRGAHYFLKITQKGSNLLSDIKSNLIPESYHEKEKEFIKEEEISSISTEFSKFSYGILISLWQGLLDQISSLDERRILHSKKPRINILIEKCHAQLQEKFSKIIDSKI